MGVLGFLTAGGLGAVLVAIIAGLFNRRKVSGDYVTAIAGAATTLVAPLQAEVARLTASLAAQETRHEREVAELRDDLEAAKAESVTAREDCQAGMSYLTEQLQDARRAVRDLRDALTRRDVTPPPPPGTLGP